MAPLTSVKFVWLSVLCYFLQLFPFCEGQEPESMKFRSPFLNEEERESEHITDDLKCDACQAIAHQMNEILHKAEQKTKSKLLTESIIIDVLEELCTEGFEEYGIKDMDGVNHLSGPGLAAEETPGLVQMGGKWPKRVRDQCFMKIGEVGEEEIYKASRAKTQSLFEFLCSMECDLNKPPHAKKKEL